MQSRFQEMLKVQRQNQETARVGLKWEKDELEQLMKMVKNRDSLIDIAKALQRTEGSIKTRLILNAISKIEEENISIGDAANLMNITIDDINEYNDRRNQRITKKKTRPYANSINDVYGLLTSVNKKLDVLIAAK